MNRLDDPCDFDRDALIDLIYTLQIDLRMLTEQLAREHAPDVPSSVLLNLAVFHDHLNRSMPSLNRH